MNSLSFHPVCLCLCAAAALASLSGCEEAANPVSSLEATVHDMPVDPTFNSAPSGLALDHETALDRVLVVQNTPWFMGEAGVYRLDLDELVEVEVAAVAGESSTTGPVRAATLWGEYALILADNGVFQSFEGHLLRSGLTDDLAGLSPTALAAGPDGRLWIGAADGLYSVADGALQRVSFEGEPSVVALAATETHVVVAYPDVVMALDAASYVWERGPEVALTHLQAVGGRVVGAGPTGVWVHEGAYDWSHRATGSASAVAGDAATGRLFATTSDGVFAFEPDDAWHEDGGFTALGVGTDGNPWLLSSARIEKLAVGRVTGFEADVAPIFEAACAGCHSDGYSAPLRDFTDYGTVSAIADTVMARVSTGQMPPGGGLTAEQLGTLTAWYAGGLAE